MKMLRWSVYYLRDGRVEEFEEEKEKCWYTSSGAISQEELIDLEEQLSELAVAGREGNQEGVARRESPRYSMRSKRKSIKPTKMLPVIVRGRSLDYKPLQNTDMTDILDKLPILQDGAHPWISKLDDTLVVTQPTMLDIKRLLASLL